MKKVRINNLKSLKDIASFIKTGKTPPTKELKYFNGKINWYSPGDLDKSKFLLKAKRTITQLAIEDKKANLYPKGTLLIGCIGDIGKIGVTSEVCSSNQQITGVYPNENIDVSYLYYWFKGNKRVLEVYTNKAVVPILNNRSLEKIKIPLPDLPTQKRIASILDDAQALKQKSETQLKEYDALAQSIFLDMFGDPVTNINCYPKSDIRSFVSEAKYGTSSKAFEEGSYPYLRMNNLTYSGHMNYSKMKAVNIPDKDIHKYEVVKGDLIFNRTNSKELVGKTAIFDSDSPMIIAGYLIRVRFNDKANPYYVWGYLNSRHGKLVLRNMCKSIVGMANINAQELQNIKLLVPPIELQNEFAEKIALIEQQKELAKQELKESEDLFNCLLQKAFKGKLV